MFVELTHRSRGVDEQQQLMITKTVLMASVKRYIYSSITSTDVQCLRTHPKHLLWDIKGTFFCFFCFVVAWKARHRLSRYRRRIQSWDLLQNCGRQQQRWQDWNLIRKGNNIAPGVKIRLMMRAPVMSVFLHAFGTRTLTALTAGCEIEHRWRL